MTNDNKNKLNGGEKEISRREALKIIGVGVAAFATTGLIGCGDNHTGPGNNFEIAGEQLRTITPGDYYMVSAEMRDGSEVTLVTDENGFTYKTICPGGTENTFCCRIYIDENYNVVPIDGEDDTYFRPVEAGTIKEIKTDNLGDGVPYEGYYAPFASFVVGGIAIVKVNEDGTITFSSTDPEPDPSLKNANLDRPYSVTYGPYEIANAYDYAMEGDILKNLRGVDK